MAGPRIAVLGCGANGASIAADLVASGADAVLIDQWPAHVEAMRARGLRIEMPDDTVSVPVRAYHLCDLCTFTYRFDLALVVVKAYDTAWASALIEPYLQRDGVVAGVQNGMTTDTMARVIGSDRTVGCVIECSAMLTDPGVVQRHTPPARSWFAVGGLSTAGASRAFEVAELLGRCGAVETLPDIQSAKWMKLVSNCSTLAVAALLDLPVVEAARLPGIREVMIAAGREAREEGVAAGYQALPIFGLDPRDLTQEERIPDVLLEAVLGGFVLPTTTTTFLHDWTKARRSEVDDINGLVVKRASSRGHAAPINAGIVSLAHRVERRELAPTPENAGILRNLASTSALV